MKRAKIIIGILWLMLIGSFFGYFIYNGIPITQIYSHVGDMIDRWVSDLGIWAGVIFIIAYAIRPLIFFPASILTALAGALFGPVWGIIYTMIGENMSANLAFFVARYFRKDGEYNISWVKKIDKRATEDGIITTLILRLVWAPFDAVNYGLGLTKMKQREFALGTFIGIIPGLTIFVLIGHVIGSGSEIGAKTIISYVIFSAILLIGSYCLSRHLKKRNKHLNVVMDDK